MNMIRWMGAALLALLMITGLILYRSVGWAQFDGNVREVTVDLERPDVLIRTQKLSALPKDLLRVPLMRDLLTEDFVYYYEEHPDRLGLNGAIRRIAYEHQLEWRDELLRRALDEAAEVALWRDGKGALKYWAITLERNGYAKVMQEAATIAMKDKQLTLAARIPIGGSSFDVFALEYAPSRTMLLAARGDRLVALSDPGMLLTTEKQFTAASVQVLEKLLTNAAPSPSLWARSLELTTSTAKHSVAARAHYLSFGYQRFFPSLQAVRFDFDESQWRTHALIDGKQLNAAAFSRRDGWSALPDGAAACALVPVDWALAESAFADATAADGQRVSELAKRFDGPATVCWYDKGRIHAPLFVAMLKEPSSANDEALGSVYDWSIKKPANSTRLIANKRTDDEVVWQRVVNAPFVATKKDGPERGGLKVTLARKGRYVLFSPEAARVEQAIQVLNKRYPSLAESLPPQGVVIATFVPSAMSELAQREASFMLPRSQEPVLRPIAERRLWPRLAAIKKYPAQQLMLQETIGAERKWAPLIWTEKNS